MKRANMGAMSDLGELALKVDAAEKRAGDRSRRGSFAQPEHDEEETPSKGQAVGFLDAIAPLAGSGASGAAVGFLDLIDETEAAEVERERKEEEEWVSQALSNMRTSMTLLGDVLLCMNLSPDAWGYYNAALLILFRAADDEETLVRFWVEAELKATKKEATLFREDSIRIQGIQQYLLEQVRVWFREAVYRPILRRIIGSSQARSSRPPDVIALEIIRALNANVETLPRGVQQTLEKLSKAVAVRFPSKAKEAKLYACVFLFLHVFTPAVVDPAGSGFSSQDVLERDVVFLLARIGKVMQTWINALLFQDYSSTSSDISQSEDDLSAIDSARTHLARSPGEQEVLRFVEASFKQDGPVLERDPVTSDSLADARAVVSGVIKKNYRLLRDLEGALDRQQTVAKHLGALQAKLFADAPVDSVARAARTCTVPESLAELASSTEQNVASYFSDMKRNAVMGPEISIHGARFVMMSAVAFSSFANLKSVSESSSALLFPGLLEAIWHDIGQANCKAFERSCEFSDWKASTLALLPVLAYCGRGRPALGSTSSMVKGNDFLLTIKMENSFESLLQGRKPSPLGGCSAQCGFIGGWCTQSTGRDIHVAELSCVARGDKTCFFVVSPLGTLESHVKRFLADMKISASPRVAAMVDMASGLITPAPQSEGTSSPAPREAVRISKKKSFKVSTQAVNMTLFELGEQARLAIAREAHAKVVRLFDSRSRSGSVSTSASKKALPTSRKASEQLGNNDVVKKFWEPDSHPETGEMAVVSSRCVLFPAADFGATFFRAASVLIKSQRDSGVCSRCGHANEQVNFIQCSSCKGRRLHTRNRRSGNFENTDNASDLEETNRLAAALLYLQGISAGESAAEHFVTQVEAAHSSSHMQFKLLSRSLASMGWGELSLSPLSRTDEGSGSEFWLLARVAGSAEAVDRLGSSLMQLGSPTCMTMAGMIAGWSSRVLGTRCICVEVDCVGCGTSRDGSTCTFICALPATIAERVRMCLALQGQEHSLDVLAFGFDVATLAGDETSSSDSTDGTPGKGTIRSFLGKKSKPSVGDN